MTAAPLASDSQADAARWFLDRQQAYQSGNVGAYWLPHWAKANTVAALMPERIQLRRTKGWRKPEGAVVVARPSRWGNPFVPSNDGHSFWYAKGWGRRFGCERGRAEATALAVDLYRNAYERRTEFGLPDPTELRGRDLACWCPLDQPCHADVLLDLANREVTP